MILNPEAPATTDCDPATMPSVVRPSESVGSLARPRETTRAFSIAFPAGSVMRKVAFAGAPISMSPRSFDVEIRSCT